MEYFNFTKNKNLKNHSKIDFSKSNLYVDLIVNLTLIVRLCTGRPRF
jgi:hypothetical protein